MRPASARPSGRGRCWRPSAVPARRRRGTGPSTVLSDAPDGLRLLIASTSIDTPSTSDSRMNSCRQSLHIWPVLRSGTGSPRTIRPAVGSISFTASCSLRVMTAITSPSRASLALRVAADDDVGGVRLGEVALFVSLSWRLTVPRMACRTRRSSAGGIAGHGLAAPGDVLVGAHQHAAAVARPRARAPSRRRGPR